MAFQKSNWTRTTPSYHARVYAPAAIPNTAINFGQTSAITLTVPYQFQGPGLLQVGIPAGQTNLNAGLDIGAAQLLGPASGSYGSGGHPRVLFNLQNMTNATNYTPANTDVIVLQF